ncbi:unnamed protein product [Paramecium sonneborni]|uniref:WD40-repeat-containing domain n=1 Tax=Paramecium sonneborni TaxID=65129 RepID=A0A8S1RQK5_9CILI|nr:unnamed protein product [Paramecium sonneborni]
MYFNNQSGLQCLNQFISLLSQIKNQQQIQQKQENRLNIQQEGLFESDDYHANLKDQQEICHSSEINQYIDLIGQSGEIIKLIEELNYKANQLKNKFAQRSNVNSNVNSNQESNISKQENLSINSKISSLSQQQNNKEEKSFSIIVEDLQSYIINQLEQKNPNLLQVLNKKEEQFNYNNQFVNSLNEFLQEWMQKVQNRFEIVEKQKLKLELISQKREVQNIENSDQINEQKQLDTYNFNRPTSKEIEIKQVERCQTMCFNKNDSLIATSIGQQIQLWTFSNGQMLKIGDPLNGHKGSVTYIIFSKRSENDFISGAVSGQNTIIMWIYRKDKWNQIEPNKSEKGSITSMILNQYNDKLFTCDQQGFIKMWHVSFSQGVFELGYEFKQQLNPIWGISLNQSQTYLIACGDSNKLILWEKKSEQNWVISQEIKIRSQVNRVKFTNNHEFICSTQQEGYLYEYKLKKGRNYFQESNKIQLNFEEQDQFGFPLKFIQNIYFAKHNKYFYILRSHSKKIEILNTLTFSDMNLFGTLSNDKKKLLIWNDGSFRLKQLKY